MGDIKSKNRKKAVRMVKLAVGLFAGLLLAMALSMESLAAEGVVKASSANIRSEADSQSTILASVLSGDKLTIKDQTTGTDGNIWYRVFIDGNTLGYIRSDLLSTTENVPASTTQTPPASSPAVTDPNAGIDESVTVNTDGVSNVQPVSGSVTKDQVRVRADSTTGGGIVTTIKKDVVFTVNGTKQNADGEIWYLVNYVVNGIDVTGYIRSDFVTLNGELLPVEETPVDTEEVEEEQIPEEEEVPKDYETWQEDDVWYLVDHITDTKYQISKLITTAEQNATDLINAQNKISKQKGIIVVLAILFVIMALGITLLIYKFKEMMDNDGFESRATLPRRPGSNNPTQRKPLTSPTGGHPVSGQKKPIQRPDGQRPVQGGNGQRPVQSGTAQRPVQSGNGQRPVQSGYGQRPVQNGNGQRPVQSGTGQRPVQSGNGQRPIQSGNGQRPATRPDGSSSLQQNQMIRTSDDTSAQQIEKQAMAHVESRNLEKDSTDSQTWKSKNFMADDDEFEFEFLNWDGEEEHK